MITILLLHLREKISVLRTHLTIFTCLSKTSAILHLDFTVESLQEIKKQGYLGPTPRGSIVIGLGCRLSLEMFKAP